MDNKNDDKDKDNDVEDNDIDNIICIKSKNRRRYYLVIFVCHHSVLKSSKKYKMNVIVKWFYTGDAKWVQKLHQNGDIYKNEFNA